MCYYYVMKTYTEMLNDQEIHSLKLKYFEYINSKQLPYVNYQLKLDDCTITVYQSKKVVYQGENPEKYLQHNALQDEAGSDEVGCGDYFGPVVVCAVYLENDKIEFVKSQHVDDSKKINDQTIRKIAPALMEQLPHSLLILDTAKYNLIHQTNNMNQIKAKMHNQAFLHLKNKINKLPDKCIVDQFAPKQTYYRYLQNEKEVIQNLTFETKAESKYLSVACASIIARYAFLIAWDKMEEYYHMTIPKGASSEVDQFAKKFIQQFSKEEFCKIAKIHFKNSQKIGL
ncbi:MAG: ribonuclease HIII [Traorella sp.]